MNKTKDLWTKNRFGKFMFGLMLALSAILVFINLHFTEPVGTLMANSLTIDEEEIEITRTVHEKKVKKKVIKPQDKIELVKNVEEIEEEEVLTEEETEEVETEEIHSVEEVEYVPKPDPIPVSEEPEEVGDEFVLFAQKWPYFGSCKISEGSNEEKKNCSFQAVRAFLAKNIRYPHLAADNRIEGTVVLSIIIGKTGRLESVNIERDLGGGCGEEALRVARLLEDWSPAIVNDQPVRFKMHIPVAFKLE